MNKLSFACMKTKFSPVGDIIFGLSVSVSAHCQKNIIQPIPLLTLTLTVRFSATLFLMK